MSYLLEALKRAEQSRDQQKAEVLPLFQQAPNHHRPFAFWVAMACITLLCLALLLCLGYIFYDQSQSKQAFVPPQAQTKGIDLERVGSRALIGDSPVGLSAKAPQVSPSFRFTGHYYSDHPRHRSIFIDDQMFHEGDWVTDEVRLVAITPKGALLTQAGEAFEVMIVNRW